jgi:hypothetical protein
MPPESTATPDTPQPISESPSPAIEAPAPEPTQTVPAPASTPTEVVPAPETAQIPPNEPLPPEPEPIQPPSAAAPVQTGILHTASDLLVKARVAIQDRKRKKRDKIIQALTTKNKITNDEVEKLLHVSDATATRYLSALEKEGKIKQVGRTGTGVMYSRAQ